MELILRFNDGVHDSVALILHMPMWLPFALVAAAVMTKALLFSTDRL